MAHFYPMVQLEKKTNIGMHLAVEKGFSVFFVLMYPPTNSCGMKNYYLFYDSALDHPPVCPECMSVECIVDQCNYKLYNSLTCCVLKYSLQIDLFYSD